MPFHLQIPVVVLAIQLLLFAVLLGVTCLLCSSDSETYWLAGLAGFLCTGFVFLDKISCKCTGSFSSVWLVSSRCEAVVLVVRILKGVFITWSTPNCVVLTGV